MKNITNLTGKNKKENKIMEVKCEK